MVEANVAEHDMTNTINYLNDILQNIDTLDTRDAVHRQLDQVEFLYDAVDPEMQELVDQVITRLNERLQTLT
jgi:hypothetical protein